MAKGYWIAFYRAIHDQERFSAYAKLAAPAIHAAGGKFLARGMATNAYDNGMLQRVVIAEFPSVAAAAACHESPAYREALRALGEGAVDRDMRVVEGLE